LKVSYAHRVSFIWFKGECTRVTRSWNQYCLNLWYSNAPQLLLQKFTSVFILLPFLLDLLDVLNADSAATSRAEGSWLFPSWAFSRNDQRLWEGTRSSVSRGFKHTVQISPSHSDGHHVVSKETLKILHLVQDRSILYHLQSVISYICGVVQSLWEQNTLVRSLSGRVDVKCVLEGLEMKDGSRISWASLDGCVLAGDTLFSSSLSAGILQLLLYDFKWKAFKKGFYLKWLQRLRKDSVAFFFCVSTLLARKECTNIRRGDRNTPNSTQHHMTTSDIGHSNIAEQCITHREWCWKGSCEETLK